MREERKGALRVCLCVRVRGREGEGERDPGETKRDGELGRSLPAARGSSLSASKIYEVSRCSRGAAVRSANNLPGR